MPQNLVYLRKFKESINLFTTSDFIMSIEWKTSNNSVDYEEAVAYMERRVEAISLHRANELIWFLEHGSIYTAGSSANISELLNQKDLKVYATGRGGKYTYHGPGQRIIYLMLDLKKRGKDLHGYVAKLEEWIINSLKEVGVPCKRKEGKIGVWTTSKAGKDVKIAAIGIRVRKWITYHGISINICPNLEYYNGIIPCGIKEFSVSSLQELGYNASHQKIDETLKSKFNDYF